MSFLDRFKPKQEVVVQAVSPIIYVPQPAITTEHRMGMWVMTSEGVAITTPTGYVLIKEDGSNKMTLDENDKAVPHVVAEAQRQALLEEIPECRRPARDNVFGYGSGV